MPTASHTKIQNCVRHVLDEAVNHGNHRDSRKNPTPSDQKHSSSRRYVLRSSKLVSSNRVTTDSAWSF